MRMKRRRKITLPRSPQMRLRLQPGQMEQRVGVNLAEVRNCRCALSGKDLSF